MVRMRMVGWGLLVALALGACHHNGDDGKQTQQPEASATTAQPPVLTAVDPRWVSRNPQSPHKIAVVFVHGLFGDTLGTWTNANTKSFFDWLHEDPALGSNVDIYAFGYTSKLISQGSLKIGEAAVKLNDSLVRDGVDKYDAIVFVAHSMGGLVTMRELISHPEIRAKTPLLVFYATPQLGSQITDIARHLTSNGAVREMVPVDEANDYLQQLDEDWVNVRNATPRPTMVCAYETKDTDGVRIVPWSSSTAHCDQVASAIEDSDHLSIVKPDRAAHPSVTVLVNAINKYVMPALDETAWKTEKIDRAQDPWSYAINNAGTGDWVKFDNLSAVPLHYSLEPVTDGLLISPTTQRNVAAGANDSVLMALLSPIKPEYKLKLRLGSGAEHVLVARILDMNAALAQRSEVENSAAHEINAYLATGDNNAQFKLLPADQQQEKLMTLASAGVAKTQPRLPADARLLLTADVLTSLNLSNSAATALSSVEQNYPETAKSATFRNLASKVSVRTGNRDVVDAATPQVPVDAAVAPADRSQTTEAQRRELSQLADRLATVPATAAEATVLKGDVQTAAGEHEAAAVTYERAEAVKASPVTSDRVRRAATMVSH